MQVRPFICFMLLLLAFTAALLAFASPLQPAAQKDAIPAGNSGNDEKQVQAADGSVMWESVSRHLLSVVQ